MKNAVSRKSRKETCCVRIANQSFKKIIDVDIEAEMMGMIGVNLMILLVATVKIVPAVAAKGCTVKAKAVQKAVI